MNLPLSPKDTIAAVATAPGRGGIGIVRISGSLAYSIAETITSKCAVPRQAEFCSFKDSDGQNIDEGLVLFFKGPLSFTGEDCIELQGHGGPVVLDSLLQQSLKLGARLAQPGEFSQRAFLNDKIDLAQAEAIADLIDASSQQAARSAVNSLQGVFSKKVTQLVHDLTQLRVYVEAAIDFPEEEIDFLSDGKVSSDLNHIVEQLNKLLTESQQGVIIRDGIRVAIAGKPNAGKSSLLNALAEKDSAIVTHIEGTTRDVLREFVHLDGMPLHLIDTAGLRENPDTVEKIGIEKAQKEFQSADHILLMVDSSHERKSQLNSLWPLGERPQRSKITLILNKCDLSELKPGPVEEIDGTPTFAISAKSGAGLDALKQHLKHCAGYLGFEKGGSNEGGFTARRRHVEALTQAAQFLANGQQQLALYQAGELLAEDLKVAQQTLGEITGQISSDELLGKIFSSFCIGK